jgi:peroxidase
MDHQQNPLTGQLGEIKKVSLARLICDNSDGTITQIQPRAFRLPSK